MLNPRSNATQSAYEEFKKNPRGAVLNKRFNFADETIVNEYNNWLIIKNRFPYDTMTRINDMLVSKRPVGSFAELTPEEHAEYHKIIADLSEAGTYDARIENFPQTQSVKQHIHIHLVCWHNTA